MSDQRITEFRERAEMSVAAADPDVLLRRGRARRRNRRLAPVVAVAACAAIGFGVYAVGGSDVRSEEPPAGQPSVLPTEDLPALATSSGVLAPGDYAFDTRHGTEVGAAVTLTGSGWEAWDGGAVWPDARGTVSWGLAELDAINTDRCAPDGGRPPEGTSWSSQEAIDRIARVPGTRVTSPARPATAMGLTGSHVQVSIPHAIDCADVPSDKPVLMSTWDGPTNRRVTVDVWVVEDGDRLLILAKGVRGTPSAAQLAAVDSAVESVHLIPPA